MPQVFITLPYIFQMYSVHILTLLTAQLLPSIKVFLIML